MSYQCKADLNLNGWGAYPPAADLGAHVAEIGSYSTKMGYAGEVEPRAIFRTSAAVLRGNGRTSDGGTTTTTTTTTTTGESIGGAASVGVPSGARVHAGRDNSTQRRRLDRVSYCDWWNRPFENDGSDGFWEVVSPVDEATGLVFEAPAAYVGGGGGGAGVGSSKKRHRSNAGDEQGSSSHPASGNANDESARAASTLENDVETLSGLPGYGECHSLMYAHLRRGFDSSLTSTPIDGPFILVDRSYSPPPLRQKSLEVLFEDLGVPAAFLARDAVMACYAVGRATGTVVDIGHSGTVVTPVFDGYVEGRGVLRSGRGTGGEAIDADALRTLDGLVSSDRARRKKARKRALLATHDGIVVADNDGTDGANAAVPPLNATTNPALAVAEPSTRWERWRDEADWAMPLYQVRSRKNALEHGRRSDAMHRFARLELARQCKESGAGAGVARFGYSSSRTGAYDDDDDDGNDRRGGKSGTPAGGENRPGDEAERIREQYAAAPTVSYDLPDGTVVEMPPLTKYDAAEVLFGTDPASSETRESGVGYVRNRLDELLNATSEALKSLPRKGKGRNEGRRGEIGAGRDDGSDDDDAYGDGMGSTISSTGLKSVKSSAADPRMRGKETRRRRRPPTHASLARASLPYLTSHLPDLTSVPVQAMVCDSAFRCDRDQQSQLLGNVILCGGGACLGPDDSSVPDRLRDEVEALIHAHTPGWRVKVLAADRRERRYASWIGASIVGSVDAFADFYVSKAEYDEHGPGIANRKCP